jgi:hypothetical protein
MNDGVKWSEKIKQRNKEEKRKWLVKRERTSRGPGSGMGILRTVKVSEAHAS